MPMSQCVNDQEKDEGIWKKFSNEIFQMCYSFTFLCIIQYHIQHSATLILQRRKGI